MASVKMAKRAKPVVNMSSDENVLSMYLKEINRIPLLTRAEEDSVARAAAAGDPVARARLANANLRFVVNVAKKYQNQGMPLSDLISEGNIGLLNAIERYDVDKGYHFISYAVWWIRQAILKAICEKSRMIRLPLNRANELVQIEKARKIVQGGKGDEAEIMEIARLLNMEPSHVSDLVNISRELVSLESPVYAEKDSSTIGDFVEDGAYKSPDELAVESALREDVGAALRTLSDKEAEIIRFRFGLGGEAPMSLKEIGDRFNLTKERIRQIEKKALKRLQHPSRSRFLESYVA
ncbi:MAG: RNA polymerase subunit sigma [Treponema sp. GWB1_62_6]|nr:MAG: RNA polymerase subunit sigma [Treponema sp. GWA1_62_8]OHE64355.1 MAG: RNA polymerase subunit sigma [Treponema sp. GWC1_61_84]OHE68440.1 MAG: RNA polymerase subunit sigma [Treponema sp. RIFOXYC1_FULL_61_9]OHE70438.1 MAG: RNA polymerase subunit sigma [Treponema sp. GWB1_62_6]